MRKHLAGPVPLPDEMKAANSLNVLDAPAQVNPPALRASLFVKRGSRAEVWTLSLNELYVRDKDDRLVAEEMNPAKITGTS
jgi:hypothetical protein